MKHNEHEAESQLAAYALGALDGEDRHAVESLLAESPTHREELRQLREVVAMLPFAVPAAEPPDRVRSTLFARIEASRQVAPPQTAQTPAPVRKARSPWLVPAMLAAIATLVFALGGMTLSLGNRVARLDQTNGQLVAAVAGLEQELVTTRATQERLESQLAEGQDQLGAVSDQLAASQDQLAASQDQLAQVSARLARDEQVIAFVSAPGVATRQLAPADAGAAARGEMYMYPGEESAVVLFSGLPALAPGQTYQFWLADGPLQVAGGTFEVDDTGLARIVVQAPREVNAFSEVMVTVEPAGGSAAPSAEVVLAGSL